MFNGLAINPAYAGSREIISATGLFRKQWVGIKGAPTTQTYTIDAPVSEEKVGLGLTIYNDKIGVSNNLGAYFSYAYRFKIAKGNLAFGLQAGVNQFKATYSTVTYTEQSSVDGAFVENVNQISPNFGSGVYYNTDRFYLGASVPRLLDVKITNGGTSATIIQTRHYFFTTGYVFDLNPDIKVKPSILFKMVKGAPMQLDLNANFWFFDALAVGASYRSGDSFDVLLELQLNRQIRIGYAYDFTTSELRKYNSGSHEIMLRYELGFTKSKMITPRYL